MYKADKRKKKSKFLVALLYKGFSLNNNSAIPDLFTLPSLNITNFCYFCNIYGITYTTLGTLRPKSPATLQLFHKGPEVYYATQIFFSPYLQTKPTKYQGSFCLHCKDEKLYRLYQVPCITQHFGTSQYLQEMPHRRYIVFGPVFLFQLPSEQLASSRNQLARSF